MYISALFVLAVSLLTPIGSFAQPSNVLNVNRADPTCGGMSPCFSSIQAAVNAAQPGNVVRIQAGIYSERITIANKNSISGSTELHRIIIESDPNSSSGSVVIRPPKASCLNGHGILIRQSRFVTLRGLTITGAVGPGITLLGGTNQNRAIHIERSRITGNGSTLCPGGGIAIALGNPETLIANSLVYSNQGNGVAFLDASGGPSWLVNNTIHANTLNGVDIVVGQAVVLANNAITGNGHAAGRLGGRHGIVWTGLIGKAPKSIQLRNNLICGNRLGEILGPVLDDGDSGNVTPTGEEGTGIIARPGCETPENIFANIRGTDSLPNSLDDDFRLGEESLAIDIGMDPRVLGLPAEFDLVFTRDFLGEGVRPSDGNADRFSAFDVGALEVLNAPPLANAGPNRTARRGESVQLDGRGSIDPEGAPLSYHWTVLLQPSGSAIALSSSASATPSFTPSLVGDYAFRLVVNDGQYDSAPATASVIVINVAPTAGDAEVSTSEDTPITVTLVASGTDASSLTFTILGSVNHGTLSVSSGTMACDAGTCAATVTYAPEADYHGPDAFTFVASDGTASSNIGSVKITVTPVNDDPIAESTSILTLEQTPVTFPLRARDHDSQTVLFSIASGPNHGAVEPTSGLMLCASGECHATVSYTPVADFNGLDGLSFTVSDGEKSSNFAVVSLTVENINDPPVSQSSTVALDEDSQVTVVLGASDIDSINVNFVIAAGPERGVLGDLGPPVCISMPSPDGGISSSSCTATVIYKPFTNFNGTDTITFRANDGVLDSNLAVINIRVNPLDDPAVPGADFFSTLVNTALAVGAPGVLGNDTDIDAQGTGPLAILQNRPANAAEFLFNTDGSFTYVPRADFQGTDTFTYTHNDNTNESGPVAVTIAVIRSADVPVASNDFYVVERGTALTIDDPGVIGNDNDINTPRANLISTLVAGPTHAASFTLNADGSFEYIPRQNFVGQDSFAYRLSGATGDSNVAMVTIAVLAAEDLPLARNDLINLNEDASYVAPTPGVLENDVIDPASTSTVVLVTGPQHATLFTLGADGSFEYSPNRDFNGFDSFSYRVFDGQRYGNVAMTTINVLAQNDPPMAQPQSVATTEDTPLLIGLAAADVDNKEVAFTIVSAPAHGVLGAISIPNCISKAAGTDCSATVSYTPGLDFSGQDSFSYSATDGDLASSPVWAVVTVIAANDPPLADVGGPYHGNVGVPIQFAGLAVDAEGEPLTFMWNFGDGGSATGQNPIHTYGQPGNYVVTLTVRDTSGGTSAVQTNAVIDGGLVLNPIGDKTVNLGETLTFRVSASNPGGGPVSLYVAPLPLMNFATFNASTGVFTFRPVTTQVGTHQFTFTAISGANAISETITITVPQPVPGGTSVRGIVHNLNQTPLSNVKVALKSSGHTTFTDAGGVFTITGIPSGTQQLIVNGREANLGVYAIIAVAVNLIDGVLNNLNSPISLPDVDVDAEVQVSPTFTTVVSNPNVPGVELEIRAGTATNPDGTPFTGKLSINPVPDYGRPESRPEELRPGMAITIQPAGIRFNPPARITFPNADGMAPGNELNLWSLSPETGLFNVVGKGVVSADGQSIVTVEGGVAASAWHFPLPPASTTVPDDGDDYCERECEAEVGSTANIKEGSVFTTHTLPSYRSLGQSRSVSLTYSSATADPRPVVASNANLSVRAAVPPLFSSRLMVGGVQQGNELFTNSSALPEDADSSTRIAHSFSAANLATGRYPYEKTVFSNYQNSSIGGISNGNLIVVNRKQSPLGSGWGISDLQQLHLNSVGGILLTTGKGRARFFSGGPDTFVSPPRDFTTLARNPDNTYTRTFKDGTRFHFNAEGLQTSVVDRNGNAFDYAYDAADRLITITDPVGLVTTFTYSAAGKLQRITDPAGRSTEFQHDSAGNLVQITNPDTSFVSYTYDVDGKLTQATDERGQSTTYSYDHAGRFSQSIRPGGDTRGLVASKLAGLPNTAAGLGTRANPAPLVQRQEAKAVLVDGNGNRTELTLNTLGQVTSQKDALGQITTTEYDAMGNRTRIVRPNGAILSMTWDAKGNLLTSTDAVGATTMFSYEPVFNQVKTVRDPKGNTTTINYDTKGNPIEIIDALKNRAEMTYDSRGLLTSVTSAAGTGVQTVTSFTYDTKGNLLTTTDPNGDVTTLAYDDAGNVFRSTDAENRVSEFTYDPRNRLITVVDPDLKTTQYGYDPKGNLTQVIDAKNQISTFTYDSRDRLISAINPLNLTETFSYDANGNLLATTNRNGQTITFNYDALNRLISKTRPPTSVETGNQVTTFTYDTVGNLTRVTNPTTTVFNQYDLANRLIASVSGTESQVFNTVVPINVDTTIAENDFQFEGRTIQVNGRVLTVDGSHIFANLILVNGAVLRHSPTTATKVNKLEITVTGTFAIDATSRIDVSGLGFLGAFRLGNPFSFHGMTIGFQQGSFLSAGAGYGGLGGRASDQQQNPIYGDFRNPDEPGSGGGGTTSGSNGGGVIRIVAQSLVLDGSIRANGGAGGGTGGDISGGSGGAIRIDVGALSGSGTITANGSAGVGTTAGGGGGGRIAIYYQDASAFSFANVGAFGTTGPNSSNGGAGTVYLQGPTRETGELIVDNNNLPAPSLSTSIPNSNNGTIALTSLQVKRGAKIRLDNVLDVTNTLEISNGAEFISTNRAIAGTIDLNANSIITHLPTTATNSFKVDLSAANTTIDASSRIDVSGLGFLGAFRPGNPFSFHGMTIGFQQGSFLSAGGGYGGLGGRASDQQQNPVYGDFRNPNEPGSGGGGTTSGSNGGGVIRLVSQSLVLDGSIRANGGNAGGAGGGTAGGSGGAIRIDVGALSGSGTITANGSAGVGTTAGGGGGGRIAVYYGNGTSFNLGNVTAQGGSGINAGNGQPGTVHLEQQIANLSPEVHELPVKRAETDASDDRLRLASNDPSSIPQLSSRSGLPHSLSSSPNIYSSTSSEDIAGVNCCAFPYTPYFRRTFKPSVFKVEIRNPTPEAGHSNIDLAMAARAKIKRFASTTNAFLTHVADLEKRARVTNASDGRPSRDLSFIVPPTSFDADPVYTYDLNGNRISMLDPTGLTTYTYDALNRLTSITNNNRQTTSFAYDALGRRSTMTHANGAVSTYTYDTGSRLTNLTHRNGANVIDAFSYTYDRVGNRKSKTDNNGTTNYSYDVLNRLTQAVSPLPANPLETFAYDAVGNRINSNQTGAAIFNQVNQLLEDANYTYEYDANGNQIRKAAKLGGALTKFEYDAENRLVRVITPNSTATYRYDALGRRIEKEVDTGTVAITRYLYDNEDILLELNASNQIIARYTHGPGIDEPLIMDKGGTAYFYHSDALGSVTSLSNGAANPVQRYAYSAFGRIESRLDPSIVQPYTYTSRESDEESGLYHYRARAYDPLIGRFLQEDPARSSGGDNNFYAYALNSPTVNVDPSGRIVQVVSPDTYVDLAFLGYDLYRILTDNVIGNCDNLDENLLSLGGNLAGLAVPGITGVGAALRGGKAGRLVIGKLDDLAPSSLKPGEYVLDWANKHDSKLNWQENSSLLRQAMSEGNPIRDASVVPSTGALRSNTGFLSAERALLDSQGWKYNPQSQHWNPPMKR